MTPLLTLAVVLYSVDAVLFGYLAYVYGRTALSTRARYPTGLLIFSFLLLLQSAGTAASYVMFGPYLGEEAFPSMFTMATFEFVGVLALLRTTL